MLVSQWLAGMEVQGYSAAMLAALVIGLLNAFLRPVLIVLTLPVTFLSLGLFLFVINASLFLLASRMLDDFQVTGFWPALSGSVLYSIWGVVIDTALERLMPGRIHPYHIDL